jgi:hypothetical protein
MSIDFPDNAVDGQYFPELGQAGPNDLQYVYDEQSNSWNLIAPDNIATTDYVDGLLGDNTRNIRRNYDLHRSTNTIPASFTSIENQVVTCNSLVYPSLHTELHTQGQNDLPAGQTNDLNDVVANGYSIPEWFDCVAPDLSTGEFSFVAYDVDTDTRSRGFDHTIAFYFTNPGDLDPSQFALGYTLELKRDIQVETNGFNDDAYALFNIIRVEPQMLGSTLAGIGIGVEFLYSHNVDGDLDLFRSQGEHTFNVYAKSITSDGGSFSGPINIVYDSTETLTVSKTDDVDTMVLKVDTTNNNIITNDTYNDLINALGDQDAILNSLATVSYVNTRLGVGNINSNDANGPFLKLSGGTVTGRTVFDHVTAPSSGYTSFSIVAKPTPSASSSADRNRRDTLYLKTASDGDRIEYTGLGNDDNEIQTKSHVTSVVNSKLGSYVSKSGSTMYTNARISLSNSDKNTTFTDRQLVTWGKVKDITVAMVRNGSAQNPGEIYESGGSLFYKAY